MAWRRRPIKNKSCLLLRQYLEENTDEQHPASTAELIAFLSRQGVGAERKSIYDDMETLSAFGLDVERVRHGNASGWYLGERAFQLPELRLLVDSVQSSRFITRRKSLELIGKIEKLASAHQPRSAPPGVGQERIKSMNESIYYGWTISTPPSTRMRRYVSTIFSMTPSADASCATRRLVFAQPLRPAVGQ
jgi:hypothetical protein